MNAVADAFILDQLESKTQAARQASVWLESRIRELGEQASTAEQAVVEFRRKNNIVETSGRTTGQQQLAEINSKLGNARAETGDARAKLNRVRSIITDDRGEATVNATVADALKNEVVTTLRSQYLTFANRAADYTTRYGRDHLAVVKLRSQMQDIRNSILDELRRLAEVYKSDLEIASHKEEQLQKEYALVVANLQATSQSEIKLRDLEGAAHTSRALYDSFLARNMEQVQQQSMRIGDARLISPASPPQKPSNKKFLPIIVGALGGTILGLGLAVLRDMSDNVFRTGEQVEKLLRTKCLAMVPKLKTSEATGGATIGRVNSADPDRRQATPHRKLISTRRGAATAVVDAPFSRFAEEIRSIKLAADLCGSIKSSKVIGVTSTLPEEGKSTIAVNLARLIARTGATTALVDCDLRRSELTRILAPDAEAGMSEVVAGAVSLEEAKWRDELTELMFLPAGAGARLAHPNEILASEATQKLFENLRQLYDWVVVDLPPIGPVTDAQSTTQFIDSYLLVIEWGRTDFTTVERALDRVQEIDNCLLGALLNKVEMERLSKYSGNYVNNINKYYSHRVNGGVC